MTTARGRGRIAVCRAVKIDPGGRTAAMAEWLFEEEAIAMRAAVASRRSATRAKEENDPLPPRPRLAGRMTNDDDVGATVGMELTTIILKHWSFIAGDISVRVIEPDSSLRRTCL